ncbi:tubulin monoglycylase TTLL3 [Melanerpes formicivorus]|uniref:tubulin monoglycylase TTLL3 n=1 Tax=Melanerpes formicivorus TaxID=211600 RepID=UPI00358EFEE2
MERLVNTVPGPPGSLRQRQAGQAAAATTGHHGDHHPLLDSEQLRRAKLHVRRAIKEKKIFTVQGPYPVIRRLLWARGWVERKLHRASSQPQQQRGIQKKQLQKEEVGDGAKQWESVSDLHPESACCGEQQSPGTTETLCTPWPPQEEEEEQEQCIEDLDGNHDLMSRLVQDQVPYFIWTNHCSTINWQLLQQDQVVNHYTRVDAFATKDGLCRNLRNLPWFAQADPDSFFPRCYRLGDVDEQQAFIEDFRLTAARSLLKMALQRPGDTLAGPEQQCPKSSKQLAGPVSSLLPHLVEVALQICGQHLAILRHQDIDGDLTFPRMMGTNWDHFIQDYYRVVHDGAGLAPSRAQKEQCRTLLQCLAEQLPQLGMEGDHNVWILKPGAKSRGRGIVCTDHLEEVLRLAGCHTAPLAQASKWVVQKYLERPLLIFGTKFDVRQWFLVTDWNPLTVWFYRESYLRFCSRPFSLRCLEPSGHLCNVSIQKQFRAAQGQQHPQLPPDLIWSCHQFQSYLAQAGRAGAWHEVMVPGMKAAVVGALRSAQHLVGSRKSSFELYGADFLFGEDCQPWLLEINTSPTMAPSSAVTSRLCARVQRDTLRVVIDHKNDPACSTGAFDLIYKEAAVPTPMALSTGLKLMVEGRSLKKHQPAQHQSQAKLPTAVPTILLPPVHSSRSGRAIHGPQPGPTQEKTALLGRRNCHCLPSSATPAPLQHLGCCAESHRVLQQLSTPPDTSARASCLSPAQGACSTTPKSHQKPHRPALSSSPARVLCLPRLALSTWIPGQLSPIVGRKQGSSQAYIEDSRGHHPVSAGLKWRHPATHHPSRPPPLGRGTHQWGCKTHL